MNISNIRTASTSGRHTTPSTSLPPVLVAVVLCCAMCLGTGRAQNATVVYSFRKNGPSQLPQFVTPAQGRDGILYGTTAQGGADGSVFRISTSGAGGGIFAFDGTNGSQPFGGVTLATNGNFYGTAGFGGTQNDGVLFEITSAGKFTLLHEFSGSGDGMFPEAPPIQASDGNLYGITAYGPGTTGATVYKYSSSTGFSTLYTFGQQQAAAIGAPLLQASDGSLYGTSYGGGANGCGGVFVLTTSGTLLNDFSFPCGPGPESSAGALVQASDGNFYGTTERGGKKGDGTIFRVNSKGVMSVLYSFAGPPGDGKYPDGGLVLATDGNYYGSTSNGGEQGFGTLYKFSPTGGYQLLYSFTAQTGELESGSLLQHTNGKLYGTAFEGGRQNLGTIYALDLGLGTFVTFVQPTGRIGQTAQILGQGLTGTTSVTFNGVAATSFKVVNDTYMTAVVPGATTGKVVVTTPGGTLTSNVSFTIHQ